MFIVLACISISAIAGAMIEDSLDGQLGFLAGILLAAVAYMYVVSDVLPKMSYMTVLDYYAYSTIVFVMGIIAQSCIISIYTDGKKEP